jgi:AP-4 complex subunit epsilon-1
MTSGAHLSKDLQDLIKSIGESRSKQEEDKIIAQEVVTLKSKISEPGIIPKRMKELIIRALYIEMLGHDASFAYIHAINITNCPSVTAKRVGYVACASCLPSESQLLILLVANLQRDLQSPNHLEISAALTAVSKLVNAGFLHAFSDQIVKLVNHSHELVRKKAVIVLSRFLKLSPGLGPEYLALFRKTLCDKDPAVMGATLNCFRDILKEGDNVTLLKDMISSLTVVLRQIMDKRLPRDFDYHNVPAPWMQIRILEILAVLGENDQKASQQMYQIIGDVMRRAEDVSSNIGYAIVYQCMKTITTIYPHPPLIESSASLVSNFLTSDNNNLKYTGITGLISIVKINPSYSLRHQMIVVDCLEDTDDTLKRKTLSLLYKMTNPQNVKVIIDKLTNELKSLSHDFHLKQELVSKITELAEKFASDPKWYLRTTNSLFEIASDFIQPTVVNNLIKLIDEWREDPSIIQYTTNEYFSILKSFDSIPDCLMQATAWVLGEFGEVLSEDKVSQSIILLCRCLFKRFEDPLTKGWILTSLQKLNRGVPSEQCRDYISRFSTSRNEDLQQRCYEFAGATTKLASPPSFKGNMNLQVSFDFLNQYVQQDLIRGGRGYNAEKNRKGLTYLLNRTRHDEYKASEALQSMRLEAYQAPVREVFPQPQLFQAPARDTFSSPTVIQTKPIENRLFEPSRPAGWSQQTVRREQLPNAKEIEKRNFANTLFEGMGPTRPNPQVSQSPQSSVSLFSAPQPGPNPGSKAKPVENLLEL